MNRGINERFALTMFVAAIALAACGGGGSSGSTGGVPANPGTPTPTPTATPTATPTPSGNLPLSEAVAGSNGWVNPSNHMTLYYLDSDTATGGTCTANCLNVWPVFKPTTGSQGSGNVAIITRSDGTGQQWSYDNHPLYQYAGDSGPDQAGGEGIPDAGGHWHVARPTAAATPPPGQTQPPCVGYYC